MNRRNLFRDNWISILGELLPTSN